ncbi:MAG TPA: hypothetical protein DCP55_06670 [Chitinophagaceae bacterium]|nr:hypothetical protein [Chitinophagaceae bacterium]
MEITNSLIAAGVASIVAIVFIVLYINATSSFQTIEATLNNANASIKMFTEENNIQKTQITTLTNTNRELQSSVADTKALKAELSNTSMEFEKFKNNPNTTEGATRTLLNFMIFGHAMDYIYKNPALKDSASGTFLPAVKTEVEAMRLFSRKFESSDDFKNMLKTFGVTNENEFKEMMLKRMDTFTSLDISGFFKRNNMRMD